MKRAACILALVLFVATSALAGDRIICFTRNLWHTVSGVTTSTGNVKVIDTIEVPTVVGGTATTSDLNLKTTTGAGTTGADMHFLVGNNGATEAMTILNNGNVGMATAVPAAKLDIVGVLIGAGNKTATANKGLSIAQHQYDIAAEPEGTALITGFTSSTSNNVYIGGGDAALNAASTVNIYTGAGTTTRTGTQRLLVDSAGNFNFNSGQAYIQQSTGNVGIATTSPNSKLDVATTFTNSTNYESLRIAGTVGSNLSLTAATAGTGADNLDIVLTPAGTGAVKEPKQAIVGTTGGYTRTFSEATANITANHTITIQTNVPAGARLLGAQLRVDSALAAGETWNAQYATGATQSIAATQAVAANTKASAMFNTNAATDIASGEVDITIQRSSNPGVDAFTAQGTIRAIVYYEAFETMASL